MQETDSLHRRVPELDGLRGLAVLGVIAFHYLGPFLPSSGWRQVIALPARMGWLGVDLFFVLSGYLIASILIANRESPALFRTFYVRRCCRILPLYLPVIVVLYGFHQLFQRPPGPFLHHYLTFTQNFWMATAGSLGLGWLSVTWSVAVEEQFYLLLPALVRFNSAKAFLGIVIGCIVLAPVLRFLFLSNAGWDAMLPIRVLLSTNLDSLMLGVLVACARRRLLAIPIAAVRAAWVLCGATIVYPLLSKIALPAQPDPLSGAIHKLVISLFFVLTLLIALKGGFRFLRAEALTYTGVVSYGLYLFHEPVNWLIHRLHPRLSDWNDPRVLIVSFITVYAAAALSWELFEKRFVEYGHRFRYEPDVGPAIAVPVAQKSL